VCVKYGGRITNNHPAPLDPGFADFGGKGMKGLAVHQAVLNFASKVERKFNSEICIHLVTEELDKGLLLAYKPVEILEGDTAVELQNRVKEVEKKLIADFWKGVEEAGILVTIEREERLIREEELGILEEAKVSALRI
jgi:folate-dependent phosphoribosylglycinamide formyltransferase PurN